MPRALIVGVGGQDGAYLAELLLSKNYHVIGTSRGAENAIFQNLIRLNIRDKINICSMALNDFRSILRVIDESAPDEIYNLSGQSSVGLSFEQPVETLESIALGTLNILEAIRVLKRHCRFYNACSSECFGEASLGAPNTEVTPFRPKSPYAVAKAAAFWEVANYRDAYGLHACSGILFNHESSLRPEHFVTRKVIQTACRISHGSKERLHLGELGVVRDWGFAPEYVEAMWLMVQSTSPADYVIATGRSHSLEQFVSFCFEELGLDWKEYTDVDKSLFRPSEILRSYANPTLAQKKLGWSSRTSLRQLISRLVSEEQLLRRMQRAVCDN